MAYNYSCINTGCSRAFAHGVDFCPWCGAAQQAPGAAAPIVARRAPPALAPAPVMAAPTIAPALPPVAPARPAAPAPPAPAPAPVPVPASAPASAPSAPPPRAAKPRPAAPVRKPIRLRWWLIGLGILWLAWMLTKPTAARIERRMQSAVALAKECKPAQAQDELIALRKMRATAAQLSQVQNALNAGAKACTRAEQRRSAWNSANNAIERLLHAGSIEAARARLATFTRRWGEDARTREVKGRIDAGRRDHPLADPGR